MRGTANFSTRASKNWGITIQVLPAKKTTTMTNNSKMSLMLTPLLRQLFSPFMNAARSLRK
jgi:hypothetical protein